MKYLTNLNLAPIAALALAAVALSACGKSPSEALKSAKDGIANSDLAHTWQEQRCREPLIMKLTGGSARTSLKVSGTELTKTETFFSEEGCNEPAIAVIYTGTATKKDEIQKDVHQIDLTLNKAEVVALSEKGVELLNDSDFCGKKDWALNTPVDMSAHSRDTLCPLTNLPETTFDIYNRDGDRLYLGKGDKKDKPENRPSDLDREEPFVKQ